MGGVNLSQLKNDIARPTLMGLGLFSDSALNLVVGTAVAESDAAAFRQIGGGPALGLWQMEPDTEQDIWHNYLAFKPVLRGSVGNLLPQGPTTQHLIWNLAYGVAMCRIKYLRSPMPLPASTDATGMANMHKIVYNSLQGAADPYVNTPKFQRAIDA